MQVALHNVLLDQHLQALVTRVLVDVERVAVLGGGAVHQHAVLRSVGLAVGRQVDRRDAQIGQRLDFACVGHAVATCCVLNVPTYKTGKPVGARAADLQVQVEAHGFSRSDA